MTGILGDLRLGHTTQCGDKNCAISLPSGRQNGAELRLQATDQNNGFVYQHFTFVLNEFAFNVLI